MQNRHYCVCWHLSDRESVAMWDLYAGQEGLAIQVKRASLQEIVKSQLQKNNYPRNAIRMIAGMVQYQDFRKMAVNRQDHLLKYLAFRKDLSFEHEKEYRFVLALYRTYHLNSERYNFNLGDLSEMDFQNNCQS